MTEAIYLEVSEKTEAAKKAGRRVSVSGMLKLNKIAARWPAKAVAQFSTFSKKGSDRIVPR